MRFKRLGILGILIMSLAAIQCQAAVVFESNFTGTNDVNVVDLPEWTYVAYTAPRVAPVIDNNQFKVAMPVDGHIYTAILADQVFNPMTTKGLSFQYTINKMTDGAMLHSSSNATSRLCLANDPEWSTSSWSCFGEKLILQAEWNRATEGGYIYLVLVIANKLPGETGSDVGVIAYETYIDGLNISTTGKLKIAMELRDDAGKNDVRVGYQTYSSDSYGLFSWSGWEYSEWFDPTNDAGWLNQEEPSNLSEFSTNWKTNWTDNTYFYTEQYCPDGSQGNVWLDDAVVFSIDELPSSCEQLYQYYPSMVMAGDVNEDCKVDTLDLSIMADDWLECNDPEDTNCIGNW